MKIYSLLIVFQVLILSAICDRKKMTNSSQTNVGTVSATTTKVAHNRSNAALAPTENPAKFSGVDFKR